MGGFVALDGVEEGECNDLLAFSLAFFYIAAAAAAAALSDERTMSSQ